MPTLKHDIYTNPFLQNVMGKTIHIISCGFGFPLFSTCILFGLLLCTNEWIISSKLVRRKENAIQVKSFMWDLSLNCNVLYDKDPVLEVVTHLWAGSIFWYLKIYKFVFMIYRDSPPFRPKRNTWIHPQIIPAILLLDKVWERGFQQTAW